jgi:import inner membrane translocase subunit TIM50
MTRPCGSPRSYSNAKDRGPNPPSQDPLHSDPAKDPIASRLEDSIAEKGKASQELPTGDMDAAPGSFLSQYTPSPEKAGDIATTDSATGGPPKRESYISSTDRKRERMAKISMWGFLFGVVAGGVYLGRPLEPNERERIGWGDVTSPSIILI